MKTAKEIYSETDYYSSYTPMLEAFGEIVIRVDDNDYQGDTRVLFRENCYSHSYGYLQFGWGSCSGCDALQACNNIDEVQKLMDELKDSIKWFEDEAEALKFFNEHDWEGDYSWNHLEQKKFVELCKKYLEPMEA